MNVLDHIRLQRDRHAIPELVQILTAQDDDDPLREVAIEAIEELLQGLRAPLPPVARLSLAAAIQPIMDSVCWPTTAANALRLISRHVELPAHARDFVRACR